MTYQSQAQVFLAYAPENQDAVETLARRLKGDARLRFWFGPWHSVPGQPLQEQMEDALLDAQCCAVFIGGGSTTIEGWQSEQMRTAIQTRVEDQRAYRVIPVLLPGATKPSKRDLPPFLRLYETVEFPALDDQQAFKRLLAGILGVPSIEIEGFLADDVRKEQLPPPGSSFAHGHALLISVANYPIVWPLPGIVLDDARALHRELTATGCGYHADNVTLLLDEQATGDGIRAGLADLAARTGPDDTAVVFFSGHGKHTRGASAQQYILPYDCDPSDLHGTAIAGNEMTALLQQIPAGRLLVLFDSCHSGGAGDPKGELAALKIGLDEDYYAALAQGRGRVVIASSRPDELSWVLPGMANSLFTHHLIEALRGAGPTLGDGYVRVFDLFRYISDNVPRRAAQHPIFKAAQMEADFPVALAGHL